MFAGPTLAQTVCMPAAQIEQFLKQRFNETRVSVALSNAGQLIERWESPAGTWTLLARTRDKQLCPFVSGDNWREIPPESRTLAIAKRWTTSDLR